MKKELIVFLILIVSAIVFSHYSFKKNQEASASGHSHKTHGHCCSGH